ncbi:hypothetical protein KKI17_00125 [Patescibacteria group bacterium]|nr:hypothetical protein [Patescibacteria group bacterium]
MRLSLKKYILQSLPGAAALLLLLGLVFVASAYTSPSDLPPGGNVAAPLNTSGTAQEKIGGLILNTGGAAYGLIVDQGRVGIGTVTPGGLLGLGQSGVYLDVDAGNNLTFTDPSAGTRLLSELIGPIIKSSSQSYAPEIARTGAATPFSTVHTFTVPVSGGRRAESVAWAAQGYEYFNYCSLEIRLLSGWDSVTQIGPTTEASAYNSWQPVAIQSTDAGQMASLGATGNIVIVVQMRNAASYDVECKIRNQTLDVIYEQF